MNSRMIVLMLAGLAAGAVHAAEPTKALVGAVNVALNRPVKSFSSQSDEALLTDGQKGAAAKFWSSRAFAAFPDHRLYPQWIAVDLGEHYRIEAVHLFPRADAPHAGQGFPEDFTIQTSREGEPWTTVVEKKGHAQPTGADAQKFAFPPCVARFVKVEATRLRPVAGNLREHLFQLAEIEVFGAPVEAPPLAAPAQAPIKPAAAANLHCQYRVNPIGIDNPRPRLSWTMEGSARGEKQTAYRVLAAASRAELDADRGTFWDSGKVASDRSIAVAYAGKPLTSGSRCLWKVMLWDKDGKPTSWSAPAAFTMGKLAAADWKGQWIGASEDPNHQAVYLRKETQVDKPVCRATAFFCGLGWSELYIDGKKVGDRLLAPGNTSYHIRTQYVVYDVTERFAAPGRKALGVVLGDGWYALWRDPWVHGFERLPYVDKPKLLLDIELEYADGSTQTISSDESWKWSFGPITRNWVGAENIDLRRSIPGWDRTGYDEAAWKPVVKVAGPRGKPTRKMVRDAAGKTVEQEVEAPPAALVVQKEPPTRIIETIKPQRLTQDPKTGAWTYEFGREFQGWPRLRARGPAGTAITIITHPTSQHTRAGSQFILAGKGAEEYEPRFHYNAVSRVEVRGLAQAPSLDDLTGCFISADMPAAGRFRSSDDTVNWINECVRRTQYAYVTGVPNDPTREKKGWTQDIQNMLESAAYLLDSQTLYERWFWDVHDGQAPDGNCPNVAPGPFYDGYNSPWWGGCMVWGPWHWYLYYGDERVLADHYPAMKKYVDYQSAHAEKNEGLQKWGLADWLDVARTPNFLVNTPAHYLFVRIVSRSAEILGHPEDAAKYAKVAEGVRDTFNGKFLDRASGRYSWQDPKTGKSLDSQAVPALALGVGMVPADVRKQAEGVLLASIAERKGFLSTGFVSTPYMLDVLAGIDPQVGHEMTMKRPAPSWYAMTAGVSSDIQREKWGGGAVIMPSLGGCIAKWHFRALAGIWPDESGPGFKKFIIKPNVVGDLHWVRCHYDSVHGRIESNWSKRGDMLVLEVAVPANTTATVHVPGEGGEVTESGQPAAKSPGVRLLQTGDGRAVLQVVSGAYRFVSRIRQPK